jgi:hypothetical protein
MPASGTTTAERSDRRYWLERFSLEKIRALAEGAWDGARPI